MPPSPSVAPRWALYPAIDLYQGACVRLSQGDFARMQTYNPDPADQAARFIESGARCLHVVDLDGAKEASPRNREVIGGLARQFPNLYIQVGGGIRNHQTVDEYLTAGVAAVIVGTACVDRPEWVREMVALYPGRIKLGLDVRAGRLAVAGWQKQSAANALEVARQFEYPNVAAIVYTDIEKDGMLAGVGFDQTVEMARSQTIPVIASGGVSDIDDIARLYAMRESNLAGVIIGRALYTGAISLEQAEARYGMQADPAS